MLPDWNNLGVAAYRCNLPGLEIYAYKRAKGFNSTVAMSNLANNFMNSGFLMTKRKRNVPSVWRSWTSTRLSRSC